MSDWSVAIEVGLLHLLSLGWETGWIISSCPYPDLALILNLIPSPPCHPHHPPPHARDTGKPDSRVREEECVCEVWDGAWIEEVQEKRARAWLRTAPLRRTEENRCKTEIRAQSRATRRSWRLFLRAVDVLLLLLLLLIIIRESDNGYRLLPRCDHGILRLPAAAVMHWVGFEVRWALGRVGWMNAIVSHI